VQADTASFKQVVQMLTGAEQPSKNAATAATAAAGNSSAAGIGGGQGANGPCRPKKPAFKLYERRSSLKNLKMIAPLAMGALPSPTGRKVGTPEILSPSVLDFPSLKLSPVTPLTGEPFNRSPASSSEDAERAAISERGFFLHPSPRGAEPPRLLPLFPVTSPRMAAPSEWVTQKLPPLRAPQLYQVIDDEYNYCYYRSRCTVSLRSSSFVVVVLDLLLLLL
jgi:hypothetical protein